MRLRGWTCLWLVVGCAPPEPGAVPGLLGQSRTDLVARFGEPDAAMRVDLDAHVELQASAVRALHRMLGPDAIMDQLRWTQGEFLLAVFVGKRPGGDWVVVDSFRWHRTIVIG